jgi:uncharacterized protein (UPF0276 family)
VRPEAFRLLRDLCGRTAPPGVLLEYDRAYPSDAHLSSELAAIRNIMGLAHV